GQANFSSAIVAEHESACSTPTHATSSADTQYPEEHRLMLDKDAPSAPVSIAMDKRGEQPEQTTTRSRSGTNPNPLSSFAAAIRVHRVSEALTYYKLPRWIKENYPGPDVSKIVSVFASCDSGFTGRAKHHNLMEEILNVSEPNNDVSGKTGALFQEMDFKYFKAAFQLKRVRCELVFHFRKTKTSKLIDLHMRWLYPVTVVIFNLYMFSIRYA
ncbi:hypothetical protein CYMTET_34975, partial [Cymbomonas tetramitiformis]